MNSFHKVFILSVLILLQGCGFQLRGDSKILDAYNPIFLEKDGLSAAQYAQASSVLKQAGARLALSGISANTLRLKLMPLKTRKVADSAQNGGVELVQIATRMEYVLLNSNDNIVIEPQTLQQSKEVELDTNNLLSQEDVLNKSRRALENSLLRGLIFKLSH